MPTQNGTVVWFTGLSGAGKSTIARVAAQRLTEGGSIAEVIDGDELRTHLSAGLGFSRRDRQENIRRAACLALALSKRCDFVLVALISPYRAMRAEVAAKLPNYVEVFVNAPVKVCEARDPKGLYAKARAGTIRHFTGLDDPYEPPLQPALELRTDQQPVEQCVQNVIDLLGGPTGAQRARASSTSRAMDQNSSLLRFRLSVSLKERFGAIAEGLDTTPSVLLRKFVIATVHQPTVAERILAARVALPQARANRAGG